MRKKLAGLALAASLLATIPVAPAQAREDACEPPFGTVCLATCVARWFVDYVFSGGTDPGYTCADV